MFEGRPSEPLLEDILSIFPSEKTPALTALHQYHQKVEKKMPLPLTMKVDIGEDWLKSGQAQAAAAASRAGSLDMEGLMRIKSYHFIKPEVPPNPTTFFLSLPKP